jgi:hypothetical protein
MFPQVSPCNLKIVFKHKEVVSNILNLWTWLLYSSSWCYFVVRSALYAAKRRPNFHIRIKLPTAMPIYNYLILNKLFCRDKKQMYDIVQLLCGGEQDKISGEGLCPDCLKRNGFGWIPAGTAIDIGMQQP